MAVIEVTCTHCGLTKGVVKNGKAPSGSQRYFCRHCRTSFQLEYHYNANQPSMHQRIIDITMNGSGVRDISRVLKISPTTVISHLKNSRPLQ
ncbi:hypothetical protein CI610_01792 [invertebrate metagenome]|uniref:InsA N-terminal domain-containing protein n=1 Tax=invertebrate metagenome TaxID=1711999 RepID=A0A2H9T7M9_9ZZZZ